MADKVAGYEWERLAVPSVDFDEAVFSESVRIRSHEVGANQQSDIVTVSNMLQVRVRAPARRNPEFDESAPAT